MKKINFKGRKHAVTATCLLVGMLVLTSSVYANYDDAKGYTNYKDALKQLAFYEENFSGSGEVTMLVDGEAIGTISGIYKMDGENQSTEGKNTSIDGSEIETMEVIKNGKSITYYPKTNQYVEEKSTRNPRGGMDMSDPTNQKAVRFMELFADTMVGDLKNNFVLTSSEDGNKSYSVNISGSQIPEVVNAGLSLMFTASNDSNNSPGNYTAYENYNVTFAKYYKEQTGEELTQDTQEQWTAEMEQLNNDFYDKYSTVLEENGDKGIVYVKVDGTYEYYDTYEEYMKNADSRFIDEYDIMKKLGNDPYIESAVCNFTLDKDGNLISNDMEATMAGTSANGKKHTVSMKINMKLSDYGTTKIDDVDTEGMEKLY